MLLLFLCQPRSPIWMSQHRKPCCHTLLPFSPQEKKDVSRPLSFSLDFFWFPGFLLSAAPISLWFSPSFTFTLSYYSIFYDVGIKFLERQTEKLRVYQASESVLTRILSLILTIFLSSFFPEKNFKELWVRQGTSHPVNIRGPLEILKHQESLKACQSMRHD